jgi:hypothetical protein
MTSSPSRLRPSLLAVTVAASLASAAACAVPDATHDPGAKHPTPAASNQSGGSGVSGESYTGKEPPPDASAP